ncbi:MAG: DUF222 domain-containing protein [Nocardioides sp.]|uniref:HNH endonuclease signature motif containing protein n=1 Tax=Nocardioides sp. TaxID=35761 RepID=UPI003F09B195
MTYETEHPLVRLVRELRQSLTAVRDVQPAFMDTATKADVLVGLASTEAMLAEVRLRVLAVADDVAEEHGARGVAAWFASATRSPLAGGRADLHLARALDGALPALARGLREGAVGVDQARAVARALAELPAEVDAETRGRAERVLVGHCSEFGPMELTRLGRHVLEVVAPEVAEAAEARRLLDLEASARDRSRLRLRRLGDGTTRLSAVLPDVTAARLATYLHAFTNPRRDDGSVRDTAAPDTAGLDGAASVTPHPLEAFTARPRQLAEAFGALLEGLDPVRLPVHGGDATTLVVTVGLGALRTELARASLPGIDDAEGLSAAQARRLACSARVIPAVLGGDGEVLDLGRGRRLFSPAQRRALVVRDGTCRAQGCTVPGAWTEAHHWSSWLDGGPTDLDNAVLLCSHHHHRVHDPGWTAIRLRDGRVRLEPRHAGQPGQHGRPLPSRARHAS